MKQLIYIAESNKAIEIAKRFLSDLVSASPEAKFWLYPIPTPAEQLNKIPSDRIIIGGNLFSLPENIDRIDLLQDPEYLAKNAAITAEAALPIVLSRLECSYSEADTLILGWGRIAQCLAQQLSRLGIPTWIFTRKEKDQAMAAALGYRIADPNRLNQFKCIANTAPGDILTPEAMASAPNNCILLELASSCHVPGEGVLHERGLPGRCKPIASGKLIAERIRHIINERSN